MLEIKCPFCGKRSQNEFSYGGDGNIKRPALGEEISTKDWDDFVTSEITQEESTQNYGNTFLDVVNGSKLLEIQQHMKFFLHVK